MEKHILSLLMILLISMNIHAQDFGEPENLTTYAAEIVTDDSFGLPDWDVQWCPDESCFAIHKDEDPTTITIFDSQTGARLQSLTTGKLVPPYDIFQFSPNGTHILISDFVENRTLLWNWRSDEAREIQHERAGFIGEPTFSNDGSMVLLYWSDVEMNQLTTTIWDITSDEATQTLAGWAVQVNSSEWLVNKRQHLEILDENFEPYATQSFQKFLRPFFQVNSSKTHVLLVEEVDSRDSSTAIIWDLSTHTVKIKVKFLSEYVDKYGHYGWLSDTTIYAASNNRMTIWDINTGEEVASLIVPQGRFRYDWLWSAEHNAIVLPFYNGLINAYVRSVWDIETNTLRPIYQPERFFTTWITPMMWRPNSSQVSLNFEYKIEIVDIESRDILYIINPSSFDTNTTQLNEDNYHDESHHGEEDHDELHSEGRDESSRCCTFELEGTLWNSTGDTLLVWGSGEKDTLYIIHVPHRTGDHL